jgi:hypothetical protein
MNRRVVTSISLTVIALLVVVGASLMPVSAANRGTVKIDGIPFDLYPDNEPHPGCVFRLKFFGFDDGTNVSYKFSVHPPTSDTNGPGSLITPPGKVDLNLPAPPSGSRLNWSTGPIDLSTGLANAGVEAHPVQGFHVKLTVKTPGGAKYKVFWVECDVTPY